MQIVSGIISSPWLSLAGRLLLGGLFLYAGVLKAGDPSGFAEAIGNYQLVPPQAALAAAVILPWVEIMIGLSLLSGILFRGGALMVSLLLAVFTFAILINILRGIDVDCGCFSAPTGGAGRMGWYLFRDLGLLFFGVQLFFFGDPGFLAQIRRR